MPIKIIAAFKFCGYTLMKWTVNISCLSCVHGFTQKKQLSLWHNGKTSYFGDWSFKIANSWFLFCWITVWLILTAAIKVSGLAIYSASLCISSQKRSGMVHGLKGSQSFTCTPPRYTKGINECFSVNWRKKRRIKRHRNLRSYSTVLCKYVTCRLCNFVFFTVFNLPTLGEDVLAR